jgi:glycosyltransferase involved in cell wall biosynthesis
LNLKVFIPRDSNPEGGVSSHIETLIRTLPKDIQAQYHFSPKTPSFYKGILWARSGFSTSRARLYHLQHRMGLLEHWLNKTARVEHSLIHAHDVVAGMAALQLRKKSGLKLPVIYTVHGPLSKEIRMDLKDEHFANVIQEIEKKVYTQVDRLIAVDQGQKAIVVNEFGVAPNRISVISNAVDVEEVKQLSLISMTDSLGQEMLKRRKQCKVLLVLPRRLVEKNGPLVALQALSYLELDVHLWVVGDGPLRDTFETEMHRLGLTSRVWLLGAQPRRQTIAAMGLADMVLVPSVPSHGVIEATSIAALEGMALSKVVIASNIGGLAELIQHQHNGLLFEANDDKTLAELIHNIDPLKSQQISMMAQTFVTEKWSAQTWINNILEIYKSVLQ